MHVLSEKEVSYGALCGEMCNVAGRLITDSQTHEPRARFFGAFGGEGGRFLRLQRMVDNPSVGGCALREMLEQRVRHKDLHYHRPETTRLGGGLSDNMRADNYGKPRISKHGAPHIRWLVRAQHHHPR